MSNKTSAADSLRHAATLLESLGIDEPLGVSYTLHLDHDLWVQLRQADFRRVFAGRCVKSRNVGGDYREYSIVADGVLVIALEPIDAPADGEVTLPAMAESEAANA